MTASTPLSRRFALGAVKALVFLVVYVFAAKLGRSMDYVQENARVLLPQAGVALAFLLIFGLRYWIVVPLASLVVTLTAHLQFFGIMPAETSGALKQIQWIGLPIILALAFSNTVMAVAGAALLRMVGFSPRMNRLRDIYWFIAFAMVIAPALGSALAIGIGTYGDAAVAREPVPLFLRRWFGLGISNLLVAPMLLTWSARYRVYPKSRVRRTEAALLIVSAAIVAMIIFTRQAEIVLNIINYPLSFAAAPFILWASLRFGLRGASTITLVIAGIAVYGTSQGYGPFARVGGKEALFIVQMFLLVNGISALLLAAAIAEHTEAEERLTRMQDQLRALTYRLEESREEERTAIAREIHDELGQILTGIKMGLHSLMRKAAPESPDLADRANQLMKLSDDAVDSVRSIATALRPGILDDLGIVASLQWLAADFEKKTGLPTSFTSNLPDIDLPRNKRTALFRILQESLTNVARHAQAKHVDVVFDATGPDVVLKVRDDGVGIANVERNGRKSLGLVGMRERAMLVGGSIEFLRPDADSDDSNSPGTLVLARIPTGEAA